MHRLRDDEILALWEAGAMLHPLDRGLAALQAGYPDAPASGFADWPLGRRNQALAALHCACFGRELQAVVTCPKCAEALEFSLDAGLIAAPGPAAPELVTAGEYSFRLPTSRDLAMVAAQQDAVAAALTLAVCCCLDARPADETARWSEVELGTIGEALAAADPMAETRLALDCPSCRHQWADNLDIAQFFWTEVDIAARGLLAAVHDLASAYGWPEHDILAMSPPRRAAYLALLGPA
jgi:hypothetical protein